MQYMLGTYKERLRKPLIHVFPHRKVSQSIGSPQSPQFVIENTSEVGKNLSRLVVLQ